MYTYTYIKMHINVYRVNPGNWCLTQVTLSRHRPLCRADVVTKSCLPAPRTAP